MLSSRSYDALYVERCRARINAQVATYRHLFEAVTEEGAGPADSLHNALASLEEVFFNNLLVVLDSYFLHRSRGVEMKNGNALNEVRLLRESLLAHEGVMVIDSAIKYHADRSILHYHLGESIHLSERDFAVLAEAFLAEIVEKYVDGRSRPPER